MDNNTTETVYKVLGQAAAICAAHGVTYAVLSPGSRSAPLALSFLRNKNIKCFVLSDERSAAYTALGISRQLQQPVALICTSGTAALNYGPAVAEAFFSGIPLIVFTADRPPEWIGQADNQAVYQQGIYGKHVKAAYGLPVDFTNADAQWHAIRQVNEALNTAASGVQGPVHINIPLREPLYIEVGVSFEESKTIKAEKPLYSIPQELINELTSHKNIIFLAGQGLPDKGLKMAAGELAGSGHVFITDINSNLHGVEDAIHWADMIPPEKMPAADMVVSFGGPVLSKSLKTYLKNLKLKAHWHIAPSPVVADTYQQLTKVVQATPEAFLQAILKSGSKQAGDYQKQWLELQDKAKSKLSLLQEMPYSETKAVSVILKNLSHNSILHLGNSLPVRHAAAFPVIHESIEVYSNRGTSGIDGCVSSAVGQAIVADKVHTLIVGDLSFMYDRNGLWNNYLPKNLRIIVLNNHGGAIFRNLPGAAIQPELEEYFVVEQPLNFEHTARQHGLDYFQCAKETELQGSLDKLYTSPKAAVLELDFNDNILLSDIKKQLQD